MIARWYRLDSLSLPVGFVLIDSTESTGPLWEGPIASILEEFRDRLPPGLRPEVVFLGDQRAYPLDAVLAGLPGEPLPAGAIDYRRQLGRFPVVGPFLRNWIRQQPRPLLLVVNAAVPDLVDWATREVADSLLIYRLTGSRRLTPELFREVGPEASLDELTEHLRDPVVEVRIGGERHFVLDWEEEGFEWRDGALCGACESIPTGRFCVAHMDGERGEDAPVSQFVRKSGRSVSCPMVPTEPATGVVPVMVPGGETGVLRLWRSGRAFYCSACGNGHVPGQVWCSPESSGAVLPALTAQPRGTAWRVEDRGNWQATPYPRGMFLLDDGRIVRRWNEAWVVYSLADESWETTNTSDKWIVIDNNMFAVPS